LLAELRRLALEHDFVSVDARGSINAVFADLCACIELVITTMSIGGVSVSGDRLAQ
jgi:hypothetical protein